MHPGLWRLLLLRTRAGIRRKLRNLRTPRGFSYLILALGVLALLIFNRAFNGAMRNELQQIDTSLAWQFDLRFLARALAGLCAMTLLVGSGPSIYFNPAEIQFLFSAPIPRRDFLKYKFALYLSGLVVTAIILGVLSRQAAGFAQAFWGSLNALLFVQLFTTTLGIIDHKWTLAGTRFIRSLTLVTVFSLGAVALWQSLGAENSQPVLLETVLTAPFMIFAKTYFATNLWPDLCLWGLAAFAANLGLLAIMLQVDYDFREEVVLKSEQFHNRWLKANRTGIWGDTSTNHWRVPFIFGRSAWAVLVWRQLTMMLRTFRGGLTKILVAAAAFGPLMAMTPNHLSTIMLGLSVWAGLFLIPKVMTFDFRSDWDNMILLRTLPLEAWKIVSAQLVLPTLLATLIEATALVSILIFSPNETGLRYLALLLFLPPVNLAVFAGDNLLFLLFPAPLTPIGRLDFEFFGRSMIELLLRSTIIGLIAGLSLALALLINMAIGYALIAGLLSVWLVSLSLVTAMIPLLAWAYLRFNLVE